jgi:hypothetical protein
VTRIDVAVGEPAQQGGLVGDLPSGGVHQQLPAGGGDHALDGPHHLDVDRVADVLDGERDQAGALRLERAGDGVGHVPDLGRRRADLADGLRAASDAVEHAGGGRDGDAGAGGDGVDGGPAVGRRL